MNHLALILLLSFTLIFTVCITYAQEPPRLGVNPLKQIIDAMTTEEKVGLVMGTGMDFPGLPPEMQGPAVGVTSEGVPGAAGTTLAIPRLGIPSIVLADGPAGLRIQPHRENDPSRTFYCTAFPIATLLASTWDKDLVERVGSAVGNELKEYGIDVLLAPALNIHRNPLGGRNFEYYSEDPLVSGQMAAAMVKGVQSQGVGTSLKHFVANNHEWNRFTINVIAAERALREIYLKGFEIAVTEGNPWTIMTSYNKLNGTFASESVDLLTDILRNDWKFNGMVMTDWFGGQNAPAQMKAGNDLLMPGTARQQRALMAAIADNTLDEAILDRNIANILTLIQKSPTFQKYNNSDMPDLEKHAQLCREASAAGMILLKNKNDVLPLKSDLRLAVLGNSSFNMITGGTGSGDVNEAYTISLLEGLQGAGFITNTEQIDRYTTYLADEKSKQPPMQNPFMLPPPIAERKLIKEEINQLVSESDLALVTIGRNSGEFADRNLENDYYLSDAEEDLLNNISDAFRAAGKKVVVVLNVGGVIETASWRDKVDAILLAWQPGQESGNAIVDILSGKVNPSGKLATTFPMNYEDIPSSDNFPGTVLLGPDPDNQSMLIGDRDAEIIYNDGIWIGYRYYTTMNKKTAYPFGYGLSYTDFEYGQLELSATEFSEKLIASTTITNIGNVAGKQVVQLYLSAPQAEVSKPSRELKGFKKTGLLQPGDSETLLFELTVNDLTFFDPKSSAWIADAGEYKVQIGASSLDIRQSKIFKKAEKETVRTVTRSLVPERNIEEINTK